jgi:IS30 family transposase
MDSGLFTARNIDMLRKVRFRPRKSRHELLRVDKSCHVGRTYDNYMAYILTFPNCHIVEMDTVFGKMGGKCLLTLHFVNAHFMLAYILDSCTSEAVNKAFADLRKTLGNKLFSQLFPILLGDRGSEFTNPKPIECDEEGELVSRVFYCDPQQSQQKGALENNNGMIRRVIPKGISMDMYTQQDISMMMDHINSYSRKSINDRTPYYLFGCIYGNDTLKKLGANLIPHDKIILHPTLLKK